MKNIILLVSLLFASCATTKPIINEQPLKFSYLPPKLNLDLLMPSINIVDTASLKDFVSVAIDSGKLVTIYKDTLHLHPGILISDRKGALLIYYKSSYEYLDKKAMLANKMYSEYYDRSLDAEKCYQQEIKNLRIQAERSWLEKNLVYFGFVAGVATAILTEYAVIKSSH